jgi:hypothetical protein
MQDTLSSTAFELTKLKQDNMKLQLFGFCKESAGLNKYLYDDLTLSLRQFKVLASPNMTGDEYVLSLRSIHETLISCVQILQPHIEASAHLL